MRPSRRASSEDSPGETARDGRFPAGSASANAVAGPPSSSNRPGPRAVLAGLAAAVLLSMPVGASAEGSTEPGGPTASELMASLGLDAEQRAAVLAGEIVVVDVVRTRDNELAAGAALLVDASPERVLRSLASGRAFDADEGVYLHGRVDPVQGELEGFPEGAVDERLSSELHALLRVKPGNRFNFSRTETETLRGASRQARLGRTQRHPAVAMAMQEAWRGILQARVRDYFERGLEGVAAYDRGPDEGSLPSSELAGALHAEPLLVQHVPELRTALAKPPSRSNGDVSHQFRWLQQSVEDRVQFTLLHQAALQRGGIQAFVERHFFVGHTYNSLQASTALIAVGDRTLVVHANRTFTDAILGLAERIALRVGQSRLRSEVLGDVERLRRVVADLPVERVAGRASGSSDG